MKKTILKLANSFLTPLGAKIVRKTADEFDMSSAVRRIAGHGIPVKCVIDIGASNGKWSLDTMKILPHASYLAVEPLREREGALRSIKQARSNFDYALCVAGAVDGGRAILNVGEDLDGSTVNAKGGEPREVPVRTLDALVAEKKLVPPYLLKFDTHGYEVPILDGARQVLEKTNVIIMEVYNFKITDSAERFHDMCSRMEKLEFRCYDIAGLMLRPYDKSFWQMDLFFCRNNSKIFSHSQYK